jgi:alpha-mannosidase
VGRGCRLGGHVDFSVFGERHTFVVPSPDNLHFIRILHFAPVSGSIYDTCIDRSRYQNADHWYHQLDKLIHYVNLNASKGGPVVAFYSTPSHYTDAKNAATKKAGADWEVRADDIFPLGDNPHAYWSGYFTSRPGLKRQVRFASNFLSSARQMEVISGVTAAEVNHPTTRPSPPVGDSWTDSMEGAIGVATHHDGMSGTERQDVSNDYGQRISEGHFEVEAGVAKSLQKLAGITGEVGHCNCNAGGNCLSECESNLPVASV